MIFFRAYPIFLSILKNEGILLPCSSNLAWTCVLSLPFSKSLLGARSSGSHPIFCPGPVYFVSPSQNLLWEPEVLAPTQYFLLDLCISLAVLKIFCWSQRSWLPPDILSWTSLSHLPCTKSLVGARCSGFHSRYWLGFIDRFSDTLYGGLHIFWLPWIWDKRV